MKTNNNALVCLLATGLTLTSVVGFAQSHSGTYYGPDDQRSSQRNYDRDRNDRDRNDRYDRSDQSSAPKSPWRVIRDWPSTSKTAARDMMDKYGTPSEFTESMLVWENNGPWKRTVVHRDTVKHNFPKPHEDCLEQVLDYRVPLDKFNALAEFDGSIVIDRTKGELRVRCDSEAANMLALNLANEIVTNQRNVASARDEFARQLKAFANRESAPLTEKLIVVSPTSESADPDNAVEEKGNYKSKLRDYFDRFTR